MKRRIISLCICIIMLLTSCGVKNGDAYKASPQSLSTDKELGQETAPVEKKEPAAPWKSSRTSLSESLEGVFVKEQTVYGYYTDEEGVHVATGDITSSKITRDLVIPGAEHVQCMTVDEENSIYILDKDGEDAVLWKIDSSNQIQAVDTPLERCLEKNSTAEAFFCDSEGNYYLWTELTMQANQFEGYEHHPDDVVIYVSRVYVLDRDFQIIFYDQEPCEILSFGLNEKGEPVFFAIGNGDFYMAELDMEKQEIQKNQPLNDIPGIRDSACFAAIEDGFLFTQNSLLCKYSYEQQSCEPVLDLAAHGILPREIIYLGVQGDRIEIIDNHGYQTPTEYFLLEPGQDQKTVITVGVLQEMQDVTAAVTEFNRANAGIRVEIQDYYDEEAGFDAGITRLHLDLINGEAPDILEVSMLDYEVLTNKNIFLDLNQYLERDVELGRDDVLADVLKLYELDGHLYHIAPAFLVHSMWGKSSVVQGRQGVSFQELMELLEEQGKDINAIYGFSADEPVLKTFCTMSMDEFIDWENKTCDFTGDNFKRVLEFVKAYEGGYSEGSLSQGIAADEILLSAGMIGNVAEYQLQKMLFGENVDFLGYPTMGASGTQVSFSGGQLAINAKSENPVVAWTFLKYYLSNYHNEFGFPIVKSNYQEFMQQAMEDSYFMTEDGPMVGAKRSYKDRDVYLEIYAAEQADVDAVEALIRSADGKFRYHTAIYQIIEEESESFFLGQKEASEVMGIIQNRVELYLQE